MFTKIPMILMTMRKSNDFDTLLRLLILGTTACKPQTKVLTSTAAVARTNTLLPNAHLMRPWNLAIVA